MPVSILEFGSLEGILVLPCVEFRVSSRSRPSGEYVMEAHHSLDPELGNLSTSQSLATDAILLHCLGEAVRPVEPESLAVGLGCFSPMNTCLGDSTHFICPYFEIFF